MSGHKWDNFSQWILCYGRLGYNHRKNSFDLLKIYLNTKYNIGIFNGDISYNNLNKIIKSFNELKNNIIMVKERKKLFEVNGFTVYEDSKVSLDNKKFL